MSTSAIHTVKTALVTILQGLFTDPVYVSYGHPGTIRMDDMVAVMDARSAQEWAGMGTSRPRDEAVTAQVVFSVFRNDAQSVVTARAFAMLALLEDSIRTDPTLAVANARNAQITSIELTEDAMPAGRVSELAVTVAVMVRI